MESQLDQIFQDAIDSGKVPGVAAIVLDADGQYLLNKGWGKTLVRDTDSPKVTPRTPCLGWSLTKLITSTAALQLVEQGRLFLEHPAQIYVPEIAQIQRLYGFRSDGSPDVRPQTKQILVKHLFTHTSGFSYDFFDEPTLRWRKAMSQPHSSYMAVSSKREFSSPLTFEPGEAWKYGVNCDWLGQIVERISGQPLDEYVDEHIAKPLGLQITGSQGPPLQDENFLTVHTKDAAGKLTPAPDFRMVKNPEWMPGGSYIYTSCEEYAQIMLVLINNGTHPISKVRLLREDTVKHYVFRDWIPDIGCSNQGIGRIPCVFPHTSCEGVSLLPGIDKGWSCGSLIINNEHLPNGRSAGSGAWAGLGNCYYWIDPSSQRFGILMSAVLPFLDKDILHLFDALERAAYGKTMARQVGELGSNFESVGHDSNSTARSSHL